MRRFSEKEKNIIKAILSGYEQSPLSYLLVNAYSDIFYHLRVKFKYDPNADQQQLVFYRDVNYQYDASILNDVRLVENNILETSLLLNYLEKEEFIYLIEPSADNVLDEVGLFAVDGDEQMISVPLDSHVAFILFKSMNHRIYIGETLKCLVDDDFLTIQDKVLDETAKLTKQTMQLNRNTERQIRKTNDHIQIAYAQFKETQLLSEQAKIQSQEAVKQTQEASKQSIEVQHQTQEVAKQSQEAANQSAEAKQQTKAALDQLHEAKKQTGLSLLAVGLSIVAIVCSICVAKFITMDVRMVDDQYKCLNEELSDIHNAVDSIMTHSGDSISLSKQVNEVKVLNQKQ